MEFIARVLIASMFLYASIANSLKADRMKGLMNSKGMHYVDILFPLSMIFMFCSSLAIVFDFQASIAATYLILFMAVASYYFADFWESEGMDRDMKLNQFTMNLTVIGGLLLLAVYKC
jgi:putative oxidoreductase